MQPTVGARLPSKLHEYIIMPNIELPINFIRHCFNRTGPYCIPHWHNEIEIVYVQKGKIAAGFGSKSVIAEPGDVIYVNSNELHEYAVLEKPVELLCNTISLSFLQGKFVSSYDSRYLHPEHSLTIFLNLIKNNTEIEALILGMWEEHEGKRAGYEYAIKARLYGILTKMIRDYTAETITDREYLQRKKSLHNINIVLKYIEENYTEQIPLETLASLLNINKYYFCRFFKDTVGSTPTEYINNFRIHKAISLINTGADMTITEIAMSVGFNDSNYFTRVFKSVAGLSPSEYRSAQLQG